MPPLCDVPAIHNPGLVVHCAFVSICLRVRSCVASPLRVITLILPLYCCGILHYAVHVMFSATRVFVFAIRAFLFIPHKLEPRCQRSRHVAEQRQARRSRHLELRHLQQGNRFPPTLRRTPP